MADSSFTEEYDVLQTSSVFRAISKIVEDNPINTYGFDLNITLYLEETKLDILMLEESLKCILKMLDRKYSENGTISIDNCDYKRAFAYFYLLALRCKRHSQLTKLKDLIDKYGERFSQVTLLYKVLASYYKRTGRVYLAFLYDNYVVNTLQANMTEERTAGDISYVSTMCLLLQRNIERYYYADSEEVKNAEKDVLSSPCKVCCNSSGKCEFDCGVACKNPIKCPDYKCVYPLNEQQIKSAKKMIDNAIKTNNSYAKYYYLKAQLLVYSELFLNPGKISEKISKASLKEAIKAVHDAINLEREKVKDSNGDGRISLRLQTYFDFEERLVELSNTRAEDKERIRRLYDRKYTIVASSSIKANHDLNPTVCGGKSKFVFISYSHEDYRSVFADLLELEGNSVAFKYDKRFTGGEDWLKEVEQILKDPNCLGTIVFFSNRTCSSESLRNEIKLVVDSGKTFFCINLEGDKLQEDVLYDWIQKLSKDEIFGYIKNEFDNIRALNAITDRRRIAINRSDDPLSRSHIRRCLDAVKRHFSSAIMSASLDNFTMKNNRKYQAENGENLISKPMEDVLLLNDECNIFAVADGVTRPRCEYAQNSKNSLATRAAKIVTKKLLSTLKKKIYVSSRTDEVLIDIKDAFIVANKAVRNDKLIREYNANKGNRNVGDDYYPPACVAVAAIICGDYLCYGHIGDCMGVLIRDGQRIVFAYPQTEEITLLKEKYPIKYDKARIYQQIVNNRQVPYSYGILNGDDRAIDFVNTSCIKLERGDVVLLFSDGMKQYVMFRPTSEIVSSSARNMTKFATLIDKELHNDYSDDKAIIKIVV